MDSHGWTGQKHPSIQANVARTGAYWQGLEVVRHSAHSTRVCSSLANAGNCQILTETNTKHTMKMQNTITFNGERTGMSSSGNTEWFEFKVTATNRITQSAARSVGQIHGMGGQDFSCEEEKINDLYVYKCKAKCYSD